MAITSTGPTHRQAVQRGFREPEECHAVCVENTDANPVPVIIDPVNSPTIYNVTYPVASVIQSQSLVDSTKKFLIKHRNGGNIDLSFDAGFSTYLTIPKGNSFSESGLNLVGKTLYFRSTKTGTIEIIQWA